MIKGLLMFILVASATIDANAQTNTFPASGDVGIGTVTPVNNDRWERMLEVYSPDDAKSVVSTSNIECGVYADNSAFYGLPAGGAVGTYTSHPLSFMTNKTGRMIITTAGWVGIGTSNPQSLFSVNGNITAQKLTVTQTGWSDFVFDSARQIMPLANVSRYIDRQKHLPGIPSAAQIERDGLDIGAMEKLHMQKIEELTLYAINADEHAQQQDTLISQQQALLLKLQRQLELQQQEIEQLRRQVKGHH